MSEETEECSVTLDNTSNGNYQAFILYWKKVNSSHLCAGTFDLVSSNRVIPGQFVCPEDFERNVQDSNNIPVLYIQSGDMYQ